MGPDMEIGNPLWVLVREEVRVFWAQSMICRRNGVKMAAKGTKGGGVG